jgi:hypothetical protein
MNVFVAGPRAVSALNNDVKERLNNIMKNNFTIVVEMLMGSISKFKSFVIQ